jgi:hypothetical protein
MKIRTSYAAAPVRRELTDGRSTGAPAAQPRKPMLNDRRSTR